MASFQQHCARTLRRTARPFWGWHPHLHHIRFPTRGGSNNPPLPPPPIIVPRRSASSGRNDEVDFDIDVLSSFANIDHRRVLRTGFPEAIFGEGKTPSQIHAILDSMAANVLRDSRTMDDGDGDGGEGESTPSSSRGTSAATAGAIIATRVNRDAYDGLVDLGPLKTPGAAMAYHDAARIVSVRFDDDRADVDVDDRGQSVVVACAGTTDLPVAEEAAVTLSLSGVRVTRVYDCGVAGLHRILRALPLLKHPNVGCIIVCAGMDGALPSVVGGLVDVPVVAVPTSVGYGASLGGLSALLTMLNSCSPGVGVVNIDNGFGGAVWAMKCLNSRRR
ncbi:hypothetical protein ACHAXA_006158 [Cyclostephanos tholiformis]|uniref:phosphoribosylaminoimidazole carboxylase n=1 Tax=Cyclostephanos tholiformis TaxID=382380 RepID=A0ABD3RY73_9STRA